MCADEDQTVDAAARLDCLQPLLTALGDRADQWVGQAGMDRLEAIEADMLRYEQAVIPVEHVLLPGLYARIITIPEDCRLIGKIQVSEHLNVLLEGDITFMVGGVVQRIQAGWQGVIPGGTKKIGYTHSRTRWMTVHPNPTNETDTAKLERLIVVDSYAQYLAMASAPMIEGAGA